jgi:LPXTG-site transpeptidase (sortase) family protein
VPGSGRTWLRELGLALVTAGFVVLLFAAYDLVGTNLSEEHSQAMLAREFATALANAPRSRAPSRTSTAATATASAKQAGGAVIGDVGTGGKVSGGSRSAGSTETSTPVGLARRQAGQAPGASAIPGTLVGSSLPVPPPGGALDHLVIPAIGLSRYVVQGVSEADLQMGPGHYPGTPLPGQPGNVGIAGHRTTFGAPFFRLNEVTRGDVVLLTDTSGTTWVYGVVHQWVVDPSDTAVLGPTTTSMLTLTTCNPRFEATSRLVVRAALLERIPRGSKAPKQLAAVTTGHQRSLTREGSASGPAPALAAGTSRVAPGAYTSATDRTTTATATANPAQMTTSGGSGEGSPTVGPASAAAAKTDSLNGIGGSSGRVWLATVGLALLALLGWVATRVFAAHLRRYSKFLVLAAGTLVCLVPLWFAFENLVNLLPANI